MAASRLKLRPQMMAESLTILSARRRTARMDKGKGQLVSPNIWLIRDGAEPENISNFFFHLPVPIDGIHRNRKRYYCTREETYKD